MDTRKLKTRTGFANDEDAWSLMDEDLVIAHVLGLKDERAATAAEIVRRWNAYPELVAKLEELGRITEHWGPSSETATDVLEEQSEDVLALALSVRTILNTLKTN